MNRGAAIPNKRIISATAQRPSAPTARRPSAPAAPPTATPSTPRLAAAEPPAPAVGLATRPASAADLPWLQTWAAHLGLPAPRSRHVRSFILLKDSQRVGYLAGREDMIDAGRGREPVMWIVSAFLIPSLRGQGLLYKFGEILSQQHYQRGKIACRVAADNTRMLRLVTRGGWKKLRSTRRYSDFLLELDGPFRATRRGLSR